MVVLRHSRTGGAIRDIHNSSATKKDAESDEELHPNWTGLERRLKARIPRQRGDGVPEGRRNLKPSEEDFWHAAGVYDDVMTPAGRTSLSVASGEAACARLSTVKITAENLPRVVALYKTSVAPVLQAMRSLEGLIESPPEVIDTEVACSILPTTGGGEPGDIA
eukprot:jgi/Undpi1/1180/HiC_scaffold_10.g04642.m1